MALPSELRVGLVAADGTNTNELATAWSALTLRGIEVELIAPHDGEIRTLDLAGPGERFTVDVVAYQAQARDYDALLIPDGAEEQAHLHRYPEIMQLVRDMLDLGRAVGTAAGMTETVTDTELPPPWRQTWHEVSNTAATTTNTRETGHGASITRGFAFLPVIAAVIMAVTSAAATSRLKSTGDVSA